MIRLLLEGVYNNGEVIWLESKWFILSLLRRRKFHYSFYPDRLEWIDIMPDFMLVNFSGITTGVIWKYKFESGKVYVYKRYRYKGAALFEFPLNAEHEAIFLQLHEKLAYEAIDRVLR